MSEPGSPQHRHALQRLRRQDLGDTCRPHREEAVPTAPTTGGDRPPQGPQHTSRHGSFSARERQGPVPHHDLGWPRGLLHSTRPEGRGKPENRLCAAAKSYRKTSRRSAPSGTRPRVRRCGPRRSRKGRRAGALRAEVGRAVGFPRRRPSKRAPFPAHQKHFLKLRWGRSRYPRTWQQLLPAAERDGSGNPTSQAKSALRQLPGPRAGPSQVRAARAPRAPAPGPPLTWLPRAGGVRIRGPVPGRGAEASRRGSAACGDAACSPEAQEQFRPRRRRSHSWAPVEGAAPPPPAPAPAPVAGRPAWAEGLFVSKLR